MDEIDVTKKAPKVWTHERDRKGGDITDADLIRKRSELWKDLHDRVCEPTHGEGYEYDWDGNGGGGHGGSSGDTECGDYDFNEDFNNDFDICWGGGDHPGGDENEYGDFDSNDYSGNDFYSDESDEEEG